MKNHIKPHSISIKNTFSAFYPPQNCHKRKPNREVGAGVREGIRPTAIDTKSIACSPTKGGAQQSCGVQSTRSNRKRKPTERLGLVFVKGFAQQRLIQSQSRAARPKAGRNRVTVCKAHVRIAKENPTERLGLVFVKGFEPPTCGLGNRRSILLSYTNVFHVLLFIS